MAVLCASCAVGPTIDKGPGVFDTAAVQDTDLAADTDPATVDTGLDTGVADTDAADTDDTDTGLVGTTVFEITLTADDAWELWIDGVAVAAPGQANWQMVDTVRVEVPGQRHVVAIHAYDQLRVISGVIAKVIANGEVVGLTGDGRWKTTGAQPDPSWNQHLFDDSSWGTETACTPSEEAVWGRGIPGVATLLDDGAHWQWSASCRSLGQAWFRLHVGE
jgi:hypothetical protein